MMNNNYIPDRKQEDNWVVWGYYCRDRSCGQELEPDQKECPKCGKPKTKPPIEATDRRKYAKSNDPSTWVSFEQACEYHHREDTHTEGVGLMLESEGVVAGVDLDGCVHPETKEIEPWAEDIIERLDTYTEYSPSGTGLRAFVVGILPEGRRRKEQERTIHLPDWVEEQKTPEVELYDSGRYLTFTGDKLEGAPNECKQRNSTLKEIHQEYVAEEEQDKSTPSVTPNPNSVGEEELIERAKNASNGDKFKRLWNGNTSGYPSHSEARMALLQQLAFWTGGDRSQMRKLFKQSGMYPHPEKPGKCDRVMDTETKNAIRFCDEFYDPTDNGQEPPDGDAVDIGLYTSINGYETAIESVKDILADFEATDELTDTQEKQLYTFIGKIPESDFNEHKDDFKEALDISAWQLNEHRRFEQQVVEHSQVLVEDGKTWYLTEDEPRRRIELLNFEFNVDSILELDGEDRIEATFGRYRQVQFTPQKFQSKQRFKDLIGDFAGLVFEAGDHHDKALNELNKYCDSLDVPRLKGTRHMGLHDDEFVLPNGSISEDGWKEEPETVYVERGVGMERKATMPKEEFQTEDVADIVDILTTLPDTRDTTRLLPVLSWFYAAPLKPVIRNEFRENEFNHLAVTGDTGSGKTTTLQYIWKMFGVDDSKPLSAKDTKFAQIATIASSKSVPIWFDEYKPSDMKDYEIDNLHDLYRKATIGGVEQRGTKDQSTKEYELKAPIVLSGEEQINGKAERRRTIMVRFKDSVTSSGTETHQAYQKLVGQNKVEDNELVVPDSKPDPLNHARAYLQWITSADEDRLEDLWQDSFVMAMQFINDQQQEYDLDDMEIQGLQTVIFGWKIMRKFAGEYGINAESLPGEEKLRDGLRHVVGQIGPAGKRKSHMDQFVEVLSRVANSGALDRGNHYKIVNSNNQSREELRIHVPTVYDKVSKYKRDHDLQFDFLGSAADYTKRFKEAHEKDDSYVSSYSQYTPEIGSRCIGIDVNKATAELEFSITSFRGNDAASVSSDGGAKATADGSGEMTYEASGDGELIRVKDRLKTWMLQSDIEKNDTLNPQSVVEDMDKAPTPEKVENALEKLANEGLVQKEGNEWRYIR